nr:hypothetical protein [Tanacetum cinerariifolium]
EGSSSYTNEVIHSFFENQSSAPQLDYDDLEQINDDDIEEMDLKWQVAMISMRIKKFLKRTGRKLQFDTKDPVGFDKTKVKCFNCHKIKHFARDCRAKGNQDSRRRDAGYNGNKARDNGRRLAYKDDSKALVTIDGEDIDCVETTTSIPAPVENAPKVKGKQHKASCKAKTMSSVNQPLQILHMDLFGPTSDETKPIFKDFIRQVENQFNHKVKTIKNDNGTEFKNNDLIEFYGLKGIKKEYSNARTPQQNEVSKRKNKTLIEAARTMVLVTNPQNKTPYELLDGRQPIISYLRPFGCHVTILNTIDQLGKFDGKSDSGFLVGYYLNSKAFRVYNLETKRVKENLHVTFLENKPNVAGNGHAWIFDLDYLTNFMIYEPVLVENQANKSASPNEANKSTGTQANDDQSANLEEIDLHEEHFVLPIWSAYSTTIKSSGEKIEKTTDVNTTRKETTHANQDAHTNSTNLLNVVSAPISTAGPSRAFDDGKPSYPDDPSMPYLEDIYASPSERIFIDSSYDDEGSIWFTQAHRAWYATLSTFLEQSRYRRGAIDKTLFIKQDKKDIMLVQVYVDDIIFGSTKKSWCDEFEELMKNRFQMSSMGKLTFFLGLQTQKPFVKDKEAADVDVIPKTSHLQAVKRIFRYIKGQPKLGVWYPKVSSFDLKAYLDSDYAGANLNRTFTTGATLVKGRLLEVTTAKRRIDGFLSTNLMGNIELELLLFWASILIKKVNDVVKLRALSDGKRVEIFTELARMGYEKPPPNLTFYKAFFSAQWKFLIHTLVQCISTKRTVWDEFSCSMAFVFICLATDDLSSHTNKYTSLALTQKVFANIRRVGKGFLGVETRLFATMLVQPQSPAVEDDDELNAIEPTVFDDEEVTMTMARTLIKMKAKKERILDEQITKRLHDEEVKQAASREKCKRSILIISRNAQSLKRKPIYLAQAKKNMIVYLKNMVGVGGITQAYQSFEDMLKDFNREDLDTLWRLVKEKFNTAVHIVDKEKALWKLYTNCGVHQVSSTRRHDIFMLTEKDYPLSDAGMILMLRVKLQVDKDCKMARDLVMKIFMEANKPKSRSLDTSSK